MANEDTTTKFKVDISELKKAMQDARRQISLANSEFKSSSSAMGDWENSADGISEKLKQLDSVLKSQNKILDSLEQQYEQVAEEQGESSAAAERLKIAINNQKAAINKTEAEFKSYSNRLDEVKEAEQEAARTGKTVAEVLNDVGNEAEEAADGFSVFKGGLAVLAGNLMTGFVNGLKEGAQALMGLSAETREYRADIAKLDTAFATNGHSAQTAQSAYNELIGVIGETDQSVEAAQQISLLADSEKEVAKWSSYAAGVVGQFGDALQPETFYESANETLKLGEATGAYTQMLEGCGYSVEKFNEGLAECKTEEEKQQYMLKITDQLLGDAADKYRETNQSVIDANRAQSDYTDTLAALGEKVEPVMTALKIGVTDLLKAFMGLLDGVDVNVFVEKIQSGFAFLVDQVLPAVVEGFGLLVDAIGKIIDWAQKLSPVLVGLGVALAGLAIVGLVQNFTAIAGAVKTWMMSTKLMTAAQWLLNAAMSANPITLIVIAIAALVAAFVVLWNKSEAFREFWLGLWDKIKSVAGDALDAISSFFTETLPNALSSVKDWISANWESLLLMLINPFAGLFKYFYDNNTKFKEFVDNAVKFIKQLPGKVWTWLVNTINKVTTWAGNMIDKAKTTAMNFVNKVIEFMKQLPGKIWTWLVNVVSKIVTWRANMIEKAKDAAMNFVNKVIEFISELPGKVWTWLVDVVGKVASWATSLAEKGRAAAQSLVDTVVTKIQELPGKIVSIGKDLVEGLWNGINDKYTWLKNKITGWVGNVTDFLKKLFKIGSPSKLMADEIGRWLPEGMAVGIDKNAKTVLSSMKNLATDTLGTVRDNLGTASLSGAGAGVAGGVVNNYYQTINSPKQLSRFEIYRQSKNLLGLAGGR